MRTIAAAAAMLGAALGLIGCSPQQKAEANSQATHAKSQIDQASSNLRRDLSNDAVSARVKTAMLASGKLDASHISVRTDSGVVHLRGSVPSGDQRTLAAQIARDTVKGEKVAVELKVAGK